MIFPNVVQQEVNEVRNYRYHRRYYLCKPSSYKSVACFMTSHHTILSLVTVWEWTSRRSDTLRAGRSGNRIPVGARFSVPVQTGPEAYPASYTMDTGSFPGEKRPGCGFNHPPHLAPRVRKSIGIYLHSPC
jgi:hypothetical protein